MMTPRCTTAFALAVASLIHTDYSIAAEADLKHKAPDTSRLSAEEAGYWNFHQNTISHLSDKAFYCVKAQILMLRRNKESVPSEAVAKEKWLASKQESRVEATERIAKLKFAAADKVHQEAVEHLRRTYVPAEFQGFHSAFLRLASDAADLTESDDLESARYRAVLASAVRLDEAENSVIELVAGRTVQKNVPEWTVTYSPPNLGKIDLLNFEVKPKLSLPGTGLTIEPRSEKGVDRLVIIEEHGSSERYRIFELKGRTVHFDCPANDGFLLMVDSGVATIRIRFK